MFDFSNDGRMTYKSPTYDVIHNLPRNHGSPEFETDQQNVARDLRQLRSGLGQGDVAPLGECDAHGVRFLPCVVRDAPHVPMRDAPYAPETRPAPHSPDGVYGAGRGRAVAVRR